MTDVSPTSFSGKLIELTSELRALDRNLKSGQSPDATLLREFRQALDHVRMTAWTTNELMDARNASKDPETVLSFLTAERLRRFSQMVRELCGDMEKDGFKWQKQGIQGLSESVKLLQDGLDKLRGKRRNE